MATGNVRILISGGGPAGLTAAHALHKAGIDFLVLEAKDTVLSEAGASLALTPQSLRVMHQFGLLDNLLAIGAELTQHRAFTLEGEEFEHSTAFQSMKKNHGSGPVAFHRAQLIQTIYDGLPDEAKAKVLFGKKIANVVSDDESVSVTCADGSSYEGSVLIGADGVYSKTRRLMREMALKEDPTRDWDVEMPYVSEYKLLWCTVPRISEMGEACETQHKDRATMYLAGRERGWLFLFEKLPEKTRESKHYTDKDVEEFAERFADFRVNEKETVKEAFARRISAGMSDLQEGIVKHWSYKRVVLVGDACHKFTPNAGLGFNNGIQDIVALCNRMHAASVVAPTGHPSLAQLTDIFTQYHQERLALLTNDFNESSFRIRLQSWSNVFYQFMARYILPIQFIENIIVNCVMPETARQALVLDYVPAEEVMKGAVAWLHPMKAPAIMNH